MSVPARGARRHHRLGGVAVQRRHRADGGLQHAFGRGVALHRRGQHAGADRLGQHQRIARTGAGVGHDAVGMDRAGDEQAELGFLVDDRMTAGNGDAGLGADRGRAVEHLAQGRRAQPVDRPGDEAQRIERRGAHGVDVGKRIGGGDAAVVERVVDDGRKDVDRLDQGEVVAQADDGGIVGRVVADQHARIAGDRQAAQGGMEIGLADLGGAAGEARQFGQARRRALRRRGLQRRGRDVHGCLPRARELRVGG